MSFRIHAVGTRGFRWSRDNNPDEDLFQAASIISALNASSPTFGGVVEGVAEYANPAPNVIDAAAAVARMTFVRMLRTTVNELASINSGRRGWIAVTPRQTHLLWPDTSVHVRYDLPVDDHDAAGANFIRAILPALTNTGFNHYGTFRALSQAVDRYRDTLGTSEVVMLQMDLTQ